MMRTHHLLTLCLITGSLLTSRPATATEPVGCFAALAGTFAAGCKMGAEVQGKSCRGALGEVQSACASLRNCRYGCHMDKKTAKKQIKSQFKACSAACKGVKDKRACKRACKKTRADSKKAMRISRRDCKKTCRDDYKTKACRKARAKLTTWAAAAGAGLAAVVKFCKP